LFGFFCFCSGFVRDMTLANIRTIICNSSARDTCAHELTEVIFIEACT
jgi:hypothetical protein